MIGRAKKMSPRRAITVSTQPPKKPARAPRVTPMISTEITENTPTISDAWVPWMMRE